MLLSHAAFWVGFFGDFFLQATDNPSYHLKSYFEKHGRAESLFIAGGMMFGLTSLFETFFTPSLLSMSLYGGLLDVAWRNLEVFPSLKDYYTIPPQWTFLWGVIPMALTFLVSKSF